MIMLLLWWNKTPFYVLVTFLYHKSAGGYLGRLHTLTIMNSVPIKICAQLSFQNAVLESFGYIPGSTITESYSSVVLVL